MLNKKTKLKTDTEFVQKLLEKSMVAVVQGSAFGLDGYFRIVYNNFIHNGVGKFPDDRLKKLNLEILEQKKNGSYIILSEPSSGILLAISFSF